ncbi:hypothetical protein [Loktanella sp. M215]|uniref:hypothetical protein n=1 Tax=Loktanella sp. M215 TaxID=2675431 RepID=UPI001F336269|nr:hypothetical protein [Loktanella sp. M215]MCF7699942.1 hypothetical protein [Loktanella sp. M215]
MIQRVQCAAFGGKDVLCALCLSSQHITLGYSREILGNDSLSIDVSRDFTGSADGQMFAEIGYGLKF